MLWSGEGRKRPAAEVRLKTKPEVQLRSLLPFPQTFTCMLPRSLAGRTLGRVPILKGKASARSYFFQPHRPQLQQETPSSSSFPCRSSSSSPLAAIPPPGSPRPGQPPPAYPSKDKVLIILDHGSLLASGLLQVCFIPFNLLRRAHRNSPPLPLPLAVARLLLSTKRFAGTAIKSPSRVWLDVWESYLVHEDVLSSVQPLSTSPSFPSSSTLALDRLR